MKYSWFDLVLYLFAIVLMIPLFIRLIEPWVNFFGQQGI